MSDQQKKPKKKVQMSRGAQIGLVVVGLVIAAVAGYFLLVGPQKGKAASVQKEIDALQTEIDGYRARSGEKASGPVRTAELFRLTKAMPDDPDMAGVILELSRLARDTGIEFETITPQTATAQTDYQIVPITLVFDGNFYSLSDFLFRLRNAVALRDGKLDARGRLFSVQQIGFAEGTATFPNVKATLTVNAYVFGTGTAVSAAPPAAAPPAAPSDGSTTTTTTATTPTDTTSTAPPPAPSTDAAAAGGTS